MWWSKISVRRKAEVFGLLLATISLFALLSLVTHTFDDDRWFAAREEAGQPADYRAQNSAGVLGGWVAFILISILGVSSAALPLLGVLYGIRLLFNKRLTGLFRRTLAVFGALFVLGVMLNLRPAAAGTPLESFTLSLSGAIGYALSGWLALQLGTLGGAIILAGLLGGAAYLLLPWKKLALRIVLPSIKRVKLARVHTSSSSKPAAPSRPGERSKALSRWAQGWRTVKQKLGQFGRVMVPAPDLGDETTPPNSPAQSDYVRSDEPGFVHAEGSAHESAAEESHPPPARKMKLVQKRRLEPGELSFPGLELLTVVPMRSGGKKSISDSANAGAKALRRALETFDIRIADDAIEVFPGPVITRYEFQPAPGIKVSQIMGLADDLALVLRARRVRIVAPVPGKAAVGVEVPNLEAEDVYVREILESPAYAAAAHRLPLALGKDISGTPFVTDLAAMPHLLIAGATGSGKSVCINVIITSLLYRLNPRELRFLFVDPKMLELSVYEGIPHLEKPVVSRPRGAERIFEDCVREMEDRYRRLAGMGVRNLADYNARAGEDQKLPYIVVIVDELADLMMSASAAKIENLITRLAQMARAVGMHLVLATQRPSVDVITGLIKANFSSRIAFQVASKVDSRTILDGNGAEKLLGRGDMLFLSPGTHEPVRLHGAFISGAETERLVNFFKAQSVQTQKIEMFDEQAEKHGEDELDSEDMILRQAAEVVVRHKQGSVSLLQRRLGVGYQRAARLIDRLEEAGVVGAYDGSKAREVLITKEELEAKFGPLTITHE